MGCASSLEAVGHRFKGTRVARPGLHDLVFFFFFPPVTSKERLSIHTRSSGGGFAYEIYSLSVAAMSRAAMMFLLIVEWLGKNS